jgi:hypothetical protein
VARQRNAELADQPRPGRARGRAGAAGVYDVVGNKIRDVDTGVVAIAVLDETDGLIHFRTIERGQRRYHPVP